MSRWWYVATIAVALDAFAVSYERIWIDRASWLTLHGNGVHLLPLAVACFASLGLLATFAPPVTPIPRALARRHEPLLPRLGEFARALLRRLDDSRDFPIAMATLGMAVVGAASLGYGQPVALHAGAAYLVLSALVLGHYRAS